MCILLVVFIPSVSANTGTIHLSSAYNYRSVTYNTYVEWANDIYGDSLNYGLGFNSHINFTNFSINSPTNPSWTFGVVSQNGNITITAIQTNYIRFLASTQNPEMFNMTFYYLTEPTTVYITEPINATITNSSYYTTYSSWVGAESPAVYNNISSNSLVVKSTYSNPSIQFSCPECNNTLGPTFSATINPEIILSSALNQALNIFDNGNYQEYLNVMVGLYANLNQLFNPQLPSCITFSNAGSVISTAIDILAVGLIVVAAIAVVAIFGKGDGDEYDITQVTIMVIVLVVGAYIMLNTFGVFDAILKC